MTSVASRLGAFAAVLAMAALASTARADGAADAKQADALFEQGLAAAEKGDLAAACPKFEESRKLASGLGVTLYLADCLAKTNHPVRALELFREGEDLARVRKDARQKTAAARVAELTALVPRLSMQVQSAAADQVVRLDGADVSPDHWNEIQVDPGAHVVESSASGRQPFRQDVQLAPGESRAVSIPELAATPVVAAAPAPAVPAPEHHRFFTPRRTVGVVVAGAGVVSLAVGGVLLLGVRSSYNESADYCDAANYCLPRGIELRNDAKSEATVATVFSLVGLAAVGAGAVVFFTAKDSEKPVAVVPVVTRGGAALSAVARF